jgi:hypothetical protein
VKLRTGRRNPRNLYLQLGDEPSEGGDICLGLIIDPHVAAVITERLNEEGNGPQEIRDALINPPMVTGE